MPRKTPKLRSLTGIESPTPGEVKRARLRAGYSIREAAEAVYVPTVVWQSWELSEDKPGHRPMHPAFAELFALKSGLKLAYNTQYIDPTKAP